MSLLKNHRIFLATSRAEGGAASETAPKCQCLTGRCVVLFARHFTPLTFIKRFVINGFRI
ncbi:MAG: hypothetical protein HHJ17_13310 [Rhodoferax sp.]|uniref:hypothetical protein n=1 Tax=Rhodoferax sp. TaxID=50421 RepID=UPI00183EF523|nr:hypothetical protein [Rhodoferax sp.]NMM14494.1 hypothetical protein [Rhodoferax sp.]